MDALPDELLLLILGLVDDGTTLLDSVPLVCKRWRRISRDPQAWASARVVVRCCRENAYCFYGDDEGDDDDDDDDEDDDGMREVREYQRKRQQEDHSAIAAAARLLIHAPFLGRLEIDWSSDEQRNKPLHCAVEKRVVLSALRRCKADVRELVIPQPHRVGFLPWMKNPLAELGTSEIEALVDFLAKCGRSLRVLKLGQLLASKEVESVVATLTRLQTLHLVLDPDFVPSGSLREAQLSSLECLHVTGWEDFKDCTGPTRLFADLLLAAAGRLRKLRLHDGCVPLPDVAREALPRCGELRELNCDLADVAVLPALPELRWLDVSMCRYAEEAEDGCPKDADALAAATSALLHAGPLAKLQHLRVELTLFGRETAWPGLEAVLQALASAAAEATSLVLALNKLPVGQLLLERMLRLRVVQVDDCTPAVLAALARLPEMQRLRVRNDGLLKMDKEAVGDAFGRMRSLQSLSVGAGFPPDGLTALATLPELKEVSVDVECAADAKDDCHCRSAIDDFKRLRPDARAKLTLGRYHRFK